MASRKAKPDIAERFQSLYTHGFVRVAACAPVVVPANPAANADAILKFWKEADAESAAILLTPELSLSGYAIDDLLLQDVLLDAVEAAIARLVEESKERFPILIVGAPIRTENSIYNCAVVIHRGEILGVVAKTYLPNYREFYEKRHFASASHRVNDTVWLCGEQTSFGAADLIFTADDVRDFAFHVDICEDFWAPIPPSTYGALSGATILLNMSASNIVIGKAEDRSILCDAQSRRATAAYILAASGYGESTTDVAWDGQIIGYEMGEKIAEGERFSREPKLVVADVDVQRIAAERARLGTFRDCAANSKGSWEHYTGLAFKLAPSSGALPLKRKLDQFPFVPDDLARRDRDCFEAYNIQVQGLAKRVETTGSNRVVIGISGGLDSTHALIVAARAFDLLGLPRKNIVGVTMPGFATSDATKSNAWALMNALGIDAREVSIQPLAQRMLEDLDHPAARGEPVYDIAYENVQAGLRTDYLFRLANKEGGFVVGTGDLSELALGWCTYGVGDHMSHYNVNAGAPKTLIQHLIRWVADSDLFDANVSTTLRSVLVSEISPELIPGAAPQSTQAVVGPYELQDFNLYWITRYGLRPSKVLFLGWTAWKGEYDYATLKQWLAVFLKRFFANQYKRSAVPNGPKIVSGGALSPRGDWRMPSDASPAAWLDELSANTPDKLD
jgi:NAD+ synthase (glutamine-hydrolysing)